MVIRAENRQERIWEGMRDGPGQAQLLFAKTGELIPGIYMLRTVWQDVVVLRCTNPLGPWGLGGRKLGRWRFVPSRFLFCWFVSCRFIVRRFIHIRLCAGLLFRTFSCRAAAPCGCRAFCLGTAARCERGGKKRSGQDPSSDPLLFAQSAVMDFFKIFPFLSRKPHPFSACI